MSPAAGVAEALTALTAEVSGLRVHVEGIKEDVVEIRRQTTATNGRVTGLETRETARKEVAEALVLDRAERAAKRTLIQRHREWLIGTGAVVLSGVVAAAATHF